LVEEEETSNKKLIFVAALMAFAAAILQISWLFDAVLDDAGIQMVLSGVQMPRMNSVMEGGCKPAAASCLTAP